MAGPRFFDRVWETSTTTGTGTITLGGAYSSDYRTFSSVLNTGDICYYYIELIGTGEWEVGLGTYTSSGNTLARTTVLSSSNSGSAVSFGAGAKNVILDAPAAAFSIIRDYIDGLVIANNGSSSQSVSIASGITADYTNVAMLPLTGPYYKTLASTWAVGAGSSGSPNGGLDTGSVAASTWYHIYLIATPGGTVDVVISTAVSSTGPSLPSGYTYYRRIGSVFTNGSKDIVTFFQDGDEFLLGTATNDINGQSLTANTQAAFTLGVPLGIRVEWFGSIAAANTSPGTAICLRSPDAAGSATSLVTGEGMMTTEVSSVFNYLASACHTNTSQQIKVIANGTITNNFYMTTRGWLDQRGKNGGG